MNYEHNSADFFDDGHEVVGVKWFYQGGGRILDATANGTGRDKPDSVAGWSFPNVSAVSCQSAMLLLTATSGGPGTFSLFGQKPPEGGCLQWSDSNRPVGSSAFPVPGTKLWVPTTPGVIVLDVTEMVKEILASLNWIPGSRMNFWAEATSLGAVCVFQTAGASLRIKE